MDDREQIGIPEFLGGIVDRMFLSLPRIAAPFMPVRSVSRQEYEAEMDFCLDSGFVDNPSQFFTFPAQAPDFEIVRRRPYLDGEYQVISYPSGYEPRNPLIERNYGTYLRNRTGYLVRWTHGLKKAKTILCLHGYMLGNPRQAQRMFRIDKLFGLGFDVALFITPFHWKRAPESKSQRGIFLRPESPAMTCECMGQALHDLTSSCMILRTLGTEGIGLIGASLGGYLSGLFICFQPVVDFASLIVPAVNLTKPIGPDAARLPFPIDPLLRQKARTLYELHSPLNFRPLISKDRILIVASRGDLLCPFEYTKLLCERWGQPEHYFLRGGHWLIFNSRLRGTAWYRFLRRMGYLQGSA
jgi:pimeloyl-ACP methyl ester carboxylesterase